MFGQRDIISDSRQPLLNVQDIPCLSRRQVYSVLRKSNAIFSFLSGLLEPGMGLGYSWVLIIETITGLLPSLAILMDELENVPNSIRVTNGLITVAAGLVWGVIAFKAASELSPEEVGGMGGNVPVAAEVRSGGRELIQREAHADDLVKKYKAKHRWLQYLHFITSATPWFEAVKQFSRPYSSGTLANFIVFMSPNLKPKLQTINTIGFFAFGTFGVLMFGNRMLMVRSVKGMPREPIADIPGYEGLAWSSVRKKRILTSFLLSLSNAWIENAFMMMIVLGMAGINKDTEHDKYVKLMFGVSLGMASFSGIGGAADEALRQLDLDAANQQYRHAYYEDWEFAVQRALPRPRELYNTVIPWQGPQTRQHKRNLLIALLLAGFTVMILNNFYNLLFGGPNSNGESWRLMTFLVFSLIFKGFERSRLDTHAYFADFYRDALKCLQAEKAREGNNPPNGSALPQNGNHDIALEMMPFRGAAASSGASSSNVASPGRNV
ncbi:MAG: hypothetical protein K0Q57_621 [Gammaproteobacteria bacterium]|jgi:hypothetical protein|nr:hypothetical protein [Gammaproteobacteria bacterium]